MNVIVFPSGSVTAQVRTPLLASMISPGSMPRPPTSARWLSRSSTAKLSRPLPARSGSLNTCTQAPGRTCHSTSDGIGLLSAARPNSDAYHCSLLSISDTGTTANTCSIDICITTGLAGELIARAVPSLGSDDHPRSTLVSRRLPLPARRASGKRSKKVRKPTSPSARASAAPMQKCLPRRRTGAYPRCRVRCRSGADR